MQAILENADPTWVLHQEWDRTFGSSGGSSSGDGGNPEAPAAEQAQPGPELAGGVEANHAADQADATSPQNYWKAVREHLEAHRPLEDLPPLPNGGALQVVLRAVANVLKAPTHLACLDSPVPELLVFAETPGEGQPSHLTDLSSLVLH